MLATLLGNLTRQAWAVTAGQAAIAVAGMLGLLALVSPALFARLAQTGATWFDTRPFFQRIDRPFFVDSTLMMHSRAFGLVVLAGAVFLVWITPAEAAWCPAAWSLAGALALLGTIAAIWPTCFRRMAKWGNTWIDTSRLVAVLDRRIDIDTLVLRHSRLFGVVVLASIAVMATLLYGN